MKKFLPGLVIVFLCLTVFFPFIKGNLPIPSDTLIGLYHPFRDLYAQDFPNGIPFKNFLITDPVRQQYPWRFLSLDDLKHINLPLWNPYTFAGTPLLGNAQSAVFYPMNVLFFILPFHYAWTFLVFLQPVLMGWFLYVYLRYKKLSVVSCVFAAVAYAFSGFSVAWMEWNTVIHAALWLPLLLLSTEKIISFFQFKTASVQKYVLWSSVFVFSLLAAFLAGHLQTFFYLLIASVTYFFAKLFAQSKKLQIFIFLFCLVVISVLLTAVQWIPTLQFIYLSARDVDQIWTEAGWFIPPEHLVQFIAPDFFGNPTTLNYFGTWNYAELVGYIGLIPLVFAIFAVITIRRKIVYFFGGLAIVSLLFAISNPVSRIPFEFSIPFLSTSQPTRLIFLVDFALVVLAAFGIDQFQKNRRNFFIPLLIVGTLIGGLWLVVISNPFGLEIENMLIARRNLYLPSFIFFVLVFSYTVIRFVKDNRIVFLGLMILFLTMSFDSFRFAQKFLAFTPQAYLYPQTRSLEFLKSQEGLFRVMSLDSRILPPNTSIMYKLQTVEGYDPLYIRRYGELIAAFERNKPDISPPFGFNRIITPHTYDADFASLLNVGYVLSLDEIIDPTLTKVFEEGSTKIYQNDGVFPRAFSVSEVITASSNEDAIEKLFKNKKQLASRAIVEKYSSSKRNFTLAQVDVESYENNKVVLRVSSEGESFIVLSDSFYPSWEAVLENGEDLQIYQTNYTFRGIVVPSGVHRVEFTNKLF